jgi:hypothetical protein
MAEPAVARHLLRSEIPTRMAKAGLSTLRKAENDEWPKRVGAALERAVSVCGWTLDEFSGKVGRNERQCRRWMTGEEHQQMDTLFAVKELQQPLIIELAKIAGEGVEIETTVRITHRKVA